MAMRAGRLGQYVTVWQMSGEPPAPGSIGKVWASIEPSTTGDMGRRGLRAAQHVPIIARMSSHLTADRYITYRGRLFYVDGVANRDGQNEFAYISATEMVGDQGTYTPTDAAPFALRAFVVRGSDLTGQNALASQNAAIVELARFECQREWARGDTLTLNDVTWDLHDFIDGGNDGVVLRYQANAREGGR